MSTTEILAIITPVMLTFLTAVGWIGVKWAQSKAAWLEMKTAEWERMTAEAVLNSREARSVSEGNRKLIEENAVLTRHIELQGSGMQAELQAIAAASAFTAGKIKGRLEATGKINQEELEEMENAFTASIQPRESR